MHKGTLYLLLIDGVSSLPESPLELVLPDELQDSLRLLKPEGNLLKDRFRSILVRGKLETRKPIQQPKKKRRTYTEKWSYKVRKKLSYRYSTRLN